MFEKHVAGPWRGGPAPSADARPVVISACPQHLVIRTVSRNSTASGHGRTAELAQSAESAGLGID